MALKWGIASAGKISHDFVTAVGTLSDIEHTVVAVAARDLDRATEFAKLHGIPQAHAGYEALASDPNVEVVYVGVLNPQHFEVAMLMLEHGKHVLCEKPLCMNEKQSRNLIRYAERKKLFLMEAIWSRFFPSYQYLRKQIKAGILGEITDVDVEFGFKIDDVDRLAKKSLGGGTVLDLGVYVIQLSQWVVNQMPKSIKATGTLNEQGCDNSMHAEIEYSDNCRASLRISSLTELRNSAIIKGTKGQITLNQFWSPDSIVDIDGTVKTWPLPEAKHKFNFLNSCGLRYEADEVRRCIRSKLLHSDSITHNDSLAIASIEDEIRKQIGVSYDVDA